MQRRQIIKTMLLIVSTLALLTTLVSSQQHQALQNVIEPVQTFSYEAPDDCKFSLIKNQDISLVCNLRTVNSEYDTTNFSVIPIEHTTSLTILCNNELKTKSRLKPKSFAHLTQLNELALEYCKFTKLQSEYFLGLSGLRNLSIRTQNIHWPSLNLEIDASTFNFLKNLVRLDLSTNNIWSLPDGLFCSLTNLKHLNISENRLQDINELGFRERVDERVDDKRPIPPPTLSSLLTSTLASSSDGKKFSSCAIDLEYLDISYNHFVLLPENGFGILKRLKVLKINNNEISMLADKALGGLRNLQNINLSSNKIVALPSELFKDPSRSIQEIHLKNNSISVLSPGLFGNLEQLQTLDLSVNQLTSSWINRSTFKGLIRLVLLDLSSNKITKLEADMFSDLYSVQILNLRNNLLENIDANTFASMSNLHKLLLSHNKIKYLDAYSLNGLSVLALLSLDNNILTGVHPEAFRNCSSLDVLNLNGNELTKVPLALKDMRLLRTLDLGENLITTLDEPGFRGLNKVYGLRLIGNQIENISRSTFRELPELQILNLAKNQITFIERGTFEASPSIEAIRLDGNFLTQVEGLFNNMPNLVWLNVSDNNLTYFDFSHIPNDLKWLDVHKNNLTELTNIHGLDDQLRLQTLDASFNKLERVTASSIPNAIELLFLNDNLIHEIEPHTFLHKPNLTRVDLYANRITGLDQKALRLTPYPLERMLPEFYIGGNPFVCDCNIEWLKTINDQNLRSYPRVMDIDTIYCKLLYNRDKSYIPLLEAQPHHFLCGYTHHCFSICDCCGRIPCDCELKCPNNCTCFHDLAWKTNIVECSASAYRDVPKKMPNDVSELYLDGTNLIDLNDNSFAGKKNLVIFYGNNSNIQIIHNGTFMHLHKLAILHLGSNKLQRLAGHEFNGLENLRELYLQHNKLTFIDTRTFQELKKLQVIRLDDNKLVTFEIWQLTYNPYLVEIALADNLWSCDCHYLNKLQIYLQSNTEKIVDLNRMACVYNNYTNVLKEKNGTICTLKDGISSIVYSKQIEDLLPFLLMATCAFVGAFGLIMGIFCYRHELKAFIHQNCAQLFICCGYKSTEFFNDYNDKDRLYDAYLIYSIQDDNFVSQGLTNVLENDIGYRLCLHYRDFNLNMSNYIADTICEAIDNSKRAVLVLSKNFLYNEWGRFEFKGAVHEVLKRRRKLIIVLYGDIPQKDLDADMRLYLKTNLCIEWDDKKFWQKLRLALPSQTSGKHVGNKLRSNTNVYAAAPIYEGVHQMPIGAPQYPMRGHDYNTITPVNRASTLRRPVGPASTIRLDNYGQPKVCDNYEQINNCKFNTMQNNMNNNRRVHEYAVPICTPGGQQVVDGKRMLGSNSDNNNFETKYTSSASSLSNDSSEFCTRSLSSPSNGHHCAEDYSNDNINTDDVFYKGKESNNLNCKTMPSSYYCGNSKAAGNNNNTMHHHHSSSQQQQTAPKMFVNTVKSDMLNIVDENNMKNTTSVTIDKKRRLPQSDMMWA
ncbi:hypothetical protein PVAND_003293 [Polypedilum vanderplanki]|uniref:TIR domain-containing protein n=1 Tax=Polypedilum vanderplanki TaxID=319348 RepID=A0A9J6BUL2_POLVA|nr:hypothetical protein PVAND_003293 [Polypedilum vanderplanki]